MTAPEDARCPVCEGELVWGYGFTGGGLGAWAACLDCGRIVAKERQDQGACLHQHVTHESESDEG